MNKNDLITCIRISDGRKKWLIRDLAFNENYMRRHGLKRLESPPEEAKIKVPVEVVTSEPVKVGKSDPVKAVKSTPKATPQSGQATPHSGQATPQTEPINPFK